MSVASYIDAVRKSPLVGRVAHGAAWALVAAVVARGLGLATWMIVARLVEKEVFGELGIVQSTFGLLQNVGLFGLAVAATRFVAEHRANDKARVGRIIGVSIISAACSGLLIGVLLYAAAPWLAATMLKAPHLESALRVGAIVIAVASLSGVLEGALMGLEAFREMAGISVLVGSISLPLYAVAAWKMGLNGVVWMMLVTGIVALLANAVVMWRVARRHGCAVTFQGLWAEVPAFLRFGIPLSFSSQTYFAGEWLGNWMLIRQPSGYSHLGVYSAAARLQQLVLFIPMQVRRAVFPALTDRFTTGDEQVSIRMLKYYTIVFTSIAFACAVVLSLLSKLVMSGFGPEFAASWPVLVVVAFAMVLLPFRWSLEMYYRAAGAVWSEFMLNIVWVVSLVAGMILLPFEGAMRLAVAFGVAFFVANVIGVIRATMIHRVRRRRSDA